MLPSFSHVSMKYNVGDRVRASDGQLWVVVDPASKRLKCYKHGVKKGVTKADSPKERRKEKRRQQKIARRRNR